jgi:hypothetical protein
MIHHLGGFQLTWYGSALSPLAALAKGGPARRHGTLFMVALVFVCASGGGLAAQLMSSERVTTGGASVFFGLLGAMAVDALLNRNRVVFGGPSHVVRASSV